MMKFAREKSKGLVIQVFFFNTWASLLGVYGFIQHVRSVISEQRIQLCRNLTQKCTYIAVSDLISLRRLKLRPNWVKGQALRKVLVLILVTTRKRSVPLLDN